MRPGPRRRDTPFALIISCRRAATSGRLMSPIGVLRSDALSQCWVGASWRRGTARTPPTGCAWPPCGGFRFRLVCGRAGAELDLCEAVTGDLAGVLDRDLADIAQALAPLVRAEPVLHNPPLEITAQADAKAWQIGVPLE